MLGVGTANRQSFRTARRSIPWPLLSLLAFVLLVSSLILTRDEYQEAFDFVVDGVPQTLRLAGLSFLVALLLGAAVSWGLRGRDGMRSSVASSYVQLVDSIPSLVVIFLVSFGLDPLFGDLVNFRVFEWLPEGGIVIALGLIHSVTAGRSLHAGLGRRRSPGWWLPGLSYLLVAVLKDTSLASVMGMREVTGLSRLYAGSTFHFGQAFLVAAGLYATLSLLTNAASRFAESQLEGQGERRKQRTPRKSTSRQSAAPPSAYEVGQQDTSCSQASRYLAASLVLDRKLRQTVQEMIDEPNLAFAPEVGIDFKRLVKVSVFMEARERRYDNYLAAIALATAAAVPLFESYGMLVVGMILALLVQFSKSRERIYWLLPFLHKEGFDLKDLETALSVKYGPARFQRQLPDEEQNLVVYSGFIPFVGAGTPLGGWSFPVNVSRPLEDVSGPAEILPFSISELYGAVEEKIAQSDFPNLVVADYLFANGAQIRDASWILPKPGTYPADRIDESFWKQHLEEQESTARHYKWIRLLDWGNEIVISYFLRFVRQGDHVFVEVSRFLLTPVAGKHRRIDTLLPPTKITAVLLVLGSTASAPFAAIRGALRLVGRIANGIGAWDPFGAKKRRREKRVREDVYFNYGARTSLRQIASGNVYNHYFQMLDKERYVKVLEKQVIEAIVEFLEAHGIDPSDIKERRTTILNSGLIVQGGEVRAEALSVGTGARATTESSGLA